MVDPAPAVFVLVAGLESASSVLNPDLAGSHGVLYTDAARAWLAGADPWAVGDPGVVFAGPPTMLLLFVPFVALPDDLIRFLWIAVDLAICDRGAAHPPPAAVVAGLSATLLGDPAGAPGGPGVGTPAAGESPRRPCRPRQAVCGPSTRGRAQLARARPRGRAGSAHRPVPALAGVHPRVPQRSRRPLPARPWATACSASPGSMLVVLLAGFALGLRPFPVAGDAGDLAELAADLQGPSDPGDASGARSALGHPDPGDDRLWLLGRGRGDGGRP